MNTRREYLTFIRGQLTVLLGVMLSAFLGVFFVIGYAVGMFIVLIVEGINTIKNMNYQEMRNRKIRKHKRKVELYY